MLLKICFQVDLDKNVNLSNFSKILYKESDIFLLFHHLTNIMSKVIDVRLPTEIEGKPSLELIGELCLQARRSAYVRRARFYDLRAIEGDEDIVTKLYLDQNRNDIGIKIDRAMCDLLIPRASDISLYLGCEEYDKRYWTVIYNLTLIKDIMDGQVTPALISDYRIVTNANPKIYELKLREVEERMKNS